MLRFTTVILILCTLLFSYDPTPAPPLDPNDVSFIYDLNQSLSEPLCALILPIGVEYVGVFKVTDPDGEPATFILDFNDITVDANPFYEAKDPNDSLGLSKIYRYNWRWTPTADDVGLHYVNVRVFDQWEEGTPRTWIILVKDNKPPVITGCR